MRLTQGDPHIARAEFDVIAVSYLGFLQLFDLSLQYFVAIQGSIWSADSFWQIEGWLETYGIKQRRREREIVS